MEGDWRKLYSKTLTSPVWRNPDLWRFWSWCLLKATRTSITEFVRKTAVDLQPGQLIYGRRMAHKETGLSEQTVVSCVKALSSGRDPSINVQTYHNYTILTLLKWPLYQNADTTSIPQVPQKPSTNQPQPNHNLVENDAPRSPLPPRARAPAKPEVKELRVSHTHTARARDPVFENSSIDGTEVIFSPTYELCLDAWREASGRGVDSATREGARTLAQAIDAGELDRDDLAAIIRAGLRDVADGKLPNQTLRGIARNWARYVPEKKKAAPVVPKPEPVLYVAWVQKCPKCGVFHRTERKASEGPPPYKEGDVCNYWAKTENPEVREHCTGVLPKHEREGEVWK